MSAPLAPPRPVVYPETDGKPMAENTLQFQWITTVQGGLDDLFRDRPDVFVGGDNFWYPVEGEPRITQAPDVYAAFGRPKGHRRSYKQWEEGGVAPQVVWEILSPANRVREMIEKFRFYERYGVEEYFVYDPEEVRLEAWTRAGEVLVPVADPDGWFSPRMGTMFDLTTGELRIIRPDDAQFQTYLKLVAAKREADRRYEALVASLRAAGIDPATLPRPDAGS